MTRPPKCRCTWATYSAHCPWTWHQVLAHRAARVADATATRLAFDDIVAGLR